MSQVHLLQGIEIGLPSVILSQIVVGNLGIAFPMFQHGLCRRFRQIEMNCDIAQRNLFALRNEGKIAKGNSMSEINLENCENRVLAISHCNCPERAQFVKDTIEKVAKFKKIVIVNTAGVSSMYANEGGVILSV